LDVAAHVPVRLTTTCGKKTRTTNRTRRRAQVGSTTLAANSEIRRSVIGQVLAYKAGL
jgi:hypothetical protein